MGSSVARSGALDFSRITVQPRGLEALGLPMVVWRIGLRFVLAMVLVFASTFVAGAAELLRGSEPAWVDVADLPEPDEALIHDAQDGVYVQLYDTQMRWEGDTRLTYTRLTMRVLSRAGMEEAATILRDFDPSFETLTLTRLDVRRGERVMSHRDTVEAALIRRESRLEYGIIDGALTAHLQVPDVRVGDTVDVSVIWREEPRLEGATFAGNVYHDYSVPVGLWRLILNVPKARKLNIVESGDGTMRTETPAPDGGTTMVWTRSPVQPLSVDENIPPEIDPWGSVMFTSYSDWRDLTDAMAGHYGKIPVLPPEWQEKARDIASAHPDDPAARAYAALRLVQDEIRYVGVEIGPGGYFARDPALVAGQGFGDCKDKSVLLVALLDSLDVPATVALTDLDAGHGLYDRIPTYQAFDHMIVRAEPGGKAIWMDPTGSNEGGDENGAATPDYGYALPLTGPLAGKMQEIVPSEAGIDRVVSRMTIRFKGDTADVDVVSTHTGAAADRLRSVWSTEAPSSIRRGYLDYYASDYPGLVAREPATIKDDRGSNLVVLTELYHLDREALANPDLLHDFPFRGDGFRNDYPETEIGRTWPLMVGPVRERIGQLQVIDAPIDFEAPAAVVLNNPGFRMAFSATAPEVGEMTLNWHFRSLARVLPPDDIPAAVRDANRVYDETLFTWDIAPGEDRLNAPGEEAKAAEGGIIEDVGNDDAGGEMDAQHRSGGDALTSPTERDRPEMKQRG